MSRIAFATHAFWRDYKVVLSPNRFSMIVESHRHRFSDIVVVLNNFRNDRERNQAKSMADKLLALGHATKILDVTNYLTDEVLTELGLDPSTYWSRNPYFSSAQLSALHWVKGRADYILHMTGDVWLRKSTPWIPSTLAAMSDIHDMAGFNICRGVLQAALYSRRTKEETDTFWISRERSRIRDFNYGFAISDLAYVLKTNPGFDWKFSEPPHSFLDVWPVYARPCFESYVAWAIFSNGCAVGALKLNIGSPSIAHRNFPRFALKRMFNSALGRYKCGGKYATH